MRKWRRARRVKSVPTRFVIVLDNSSLNNPSTSSTSPSHGVSRDLDRGRRLASQGSRWRLVHPDGVGRVEDPHPRTIHGARLVPLQFGINRVRPSYEEHAQIEVTHSGQRTIDNIAWGVVA